MGQPFDCYIFPSLSATSLELLLSQPLSMNITHYVSVVINEKATDSAQSVEYVKLTAKFTPYYLSTDQVVFNSDCLSRTVYTIF